MKIIKLPCYDIEISLEDGVGTIKSSLEPEADAIESIVLAHAVAGVDVECPKYLEGIETAVEAIFNHA